MYMQRDIPIWGTYLCPNCGRTGLHIIDTNTVECCAEVLVLLVVSTFGAAEYRFSPWHEAPIRCHRRNTR